MAIFIKQLTTTRFEVIVTSKITTKHIVTVSHKAYKEFTLGQITKEQFVKKSFLFLLQREPNTAILKEFNIETIEKYFPEFRKIGELAWINIGV